MTYSSAHLRARRDDATRRRLAAAQRRKIDRLLDRCGSARAPACSRSAAGGASSPSAPPDAGADVAHDHAVAASSATSPARRVGRRPRWQIVSTCASPTTASVDGTLRRHRQRRDDRGGRRRVLGRRTSDSIDALLAPGGSAGIQTITKPHHRMLAERKTRTAGSTSTSSPAARSRRSRRSTTVLESSTRLRIVERIALRTRLRRHPGDLAAALRRRAVRDVDDLGFDDVFRADVALLPGVQRGRVPHRHDRRRAARPATATIDA